MDCDQIISSNSMGAAATESTICGLCKTFLFGPALISSDSDIMYKLMNSYDNNLRAQNRPTIAVLSCGHLYHADCLEQITSPVDICDPKCSFCSDTSPAAPPKR